MHHYIKAKVRAAVDRSLNLWANYIEWKGELVGATEYLSSLSVRMIKLGESIIVYWEQMR